MKSNRIFYSLAIAIILALLVIAIPATPAMAAITVTPNSGPPGTTITISSGADFTAGHSYTITFAFGTTYAQLVGTGIIATSGSILSTTFTIPNVPAGAYTIKVTATGGTPPTETTLSTTFTVTPKITLGQTSGFVGDEATVSGSGFTASSSVTIYFVNDEVGTADTDANGSFTSAVFTVPESYSGSHSVKVQDSVGKYATANFTTKQSITINPTTGSSGDEVTVEGTGFRARKSLTITFGDFAVTTSPPTVTTDDNGSFIAIFPVPVVPTGVYKAEATDGSNKASASFTVTAGGSISKKRGHVGQEITVNGTGFTVGATVTITYDGDQVAEATTNNNGAFSATFKVPTSKHGSHTIVATDPTNPANNQTFTFSVESNPPPVPKPLIPEEETKAEAQAIFDWESVEDPSGVTYDLQIATDDEQTEEGFAESAIIFERKGLTDSEYTLTEEEKLESTSKEEPYYWSVRAVDGASNVGEWSTPVPFYVGFQWPELTGWILYVLIGVGVIVLLLLGFWLGRRTAYY